MCGLYGIILHQNSHTLPTSRLKILGNALAVLSADRGTDATGIAHVWRSGNVNVYKRPLPAYEIIHHEIWNAITGTWYEDSIALMGHTRRKTMGLNNKDNAHPHISVSKKHGLLIGAHNGSIYNHSCLPSPHRPLSANDSANLITALSDEPDTKWPSVLGRASGSIALALSRNGQFYLTKNTESPLLVATMHDGTFTAYASTEHILRSALVWAKFSNYDITCVVPNRIYKWIPNVSCPEITVCEYRDQFSYGSYGYSTIGYGADRCDSCGSSHQVIEVWTNNIRNNRCSTCRQRPYLLPSGISK